MKTILNPFPLATMLGTGRVVTSSVADIRRIDNVSLALVPVALIASGSVEVQASVDYQYSSPSAEQNTVGNGTWFSVTSSLFSGTTVPYFLNFNQVAYPFIRCVLSSSNASTGTGTLWISGKALGS